MTLARVYHLCLEERDSSCTSDNAKPIRRVLSHSGTGLVGFQGVRHQRGHGFFGRILSKAVYPLLRFLGKQAVTTGANLASDMIVDKKNFKDAAKERLNEAAGDIVKEGVKRAKRFVQDG